MVTSSILYKQKPVCSRFPVDSENFLHLWKPGTLEATNQLHFRGRRCWSSCLVLMRHQACRPAPAAEGVSKSYQHTITSLR